MDPKSLAQLARKRRVWATALTLSTLCAQAATAVMATVPSSTTDKAHWNENETTALVDFLLEHKSEMGQGAMFKLGTFNAAADHIKIHRTSGPIKTGTMCRTKWRAV